MNFKKKLSLKADTNAMLTIRGIVIALLVVTVASVLFLSFWLTPSDVCTSCSPGDVVFLSGQLRGFSENQTDGNMDVIIGNSTYKFDVFDESYMKRLVGFHITVKCCFRSDQSNQIQFYDFMSAVINEGNES